MVQAVLWAAEMGQRRRQVQPGRAPTTAGRRFSGSNAMAESKSPPQHAPRFSCAGLAGTVFLRQPVGLHWRCLSSLARQLPNRQSISWPSFVLHRRKPVRGDQAALGHGRSHPRGWAGPDGALWLLEDRQRGAPRAALEAESVVIDLKTG